MHSYGTDFRHTPKIYLALAIISAVIYVGLYDVFKTIPFFARLSVSPLITLTLFGALVYLFNEWGWKTLCLFPALNVHDFSGTYEGHIRAYGGNEFPATLKIKQKWTQVEIDFESGKSPSKSFCASIVCGRMIGGQVELVYNYFAPGVQSPEGRVNAHYGTTMLRRQRGETKLDGEYYTEQSRNTAGSIELIRK